MKRTCLNIRRRFWVACIFCILIAAGCKKLVHVNEPHDSLSTNTVFSNDSLAQAAVTGLYIKIMANTGFLLNGGMSLFPGLSADELMRTFPSNYEDQFSSNAIISSNQLVNVNLWKAAYAYIYQCNICNEGLRKSTSVTTEIKNRLLGEVLFVRALCYYYLVNLYGGVPLALNTNSEVNTLLSRAPEIQVYKQIEADLLAAFDALTANRPATMPTRYAVQALLARVYLHLQNWSKAEEMASIVIDSGPFILEPNLDTVFKSYSKEIIFQWAPVVEKMNAAEGFIFIQPNPGLRPTYSLTQSLLDSFEVGDLRKQHWVTASSGSPVYYYPYKYKVYQSATSATEYNVVLRLAEQYLIRAEAFARQARIAKAVADINKIRHRAQLPDISTTINMDECLLAIEKERRIELFAEWGHRWFDLKRTNRTKDVLSITKGHRWDSNDQLYPIPISEMETAPNLKQNPGYE
jgi:tetratricopeptide (TPR) repeat protein